VAVYHWLMIGIGYLKTIPLKRKESPASCGGVKFGVLLEVQPKVPVFHIVPFAGSNLSRLDGVAVSGS